MGDANEDGYGFRIDADRGKLNADLIRPQYRARKVYDFCIIAPDEKYLAT
jgi:hypothetical protein